MRYSQENFARLDKTAHARYTGKVLFVIVHGIK